MELQPRTAVVIAQQAQPPSLDRLGPLEPRFGNSVQAIIEQTFGCLQRYRRLLVDHEGGTEMSRTMTLLAALFMTGARFERHITA